MDDKDQQPDTEPVEGDQENEDDSVQQCPRCGEWGKNIVKNGCPFCGWPR